MNTPENSQMTVEEAEKYGRQMDAKNRALEKTHYLDETPVKQGKVSQPLSEEEIKKRTGSGNFENAQDSGSMGSINS
ncbi:hypothetical protein DVB69_11865 [Sporosarcina sp. BI001-red]|uniref:hypothetical protein n=1 Tax=Sporosarcina sp. BI001-red TaxID=2282866 RepID=UPI000E249931|nr:hypothetical protein [Sporosarcina sp. BI001-red]REB06401.1 hypothetical protein DVB69_11865 [Sporosarcina sp. BI001-red]